MANPSISAAFQAAIEIDFPEVDVLSVTPYVLPLLFMGTMALLYQRHMPRDSTRRNILVAGGGISFIAAVIMLVYAAFGGTPWADYQDFGSWHDFMSIIQFATDMVYGSIYSGVIYILVIAIIFAGVATKTIAPPDPDFVKLREDIKDAQEGVKKMKADTQKLEAENKQLNEFLSEKEEALTALQAQLEAIKTEVAERENVMREMEAQLASAPVAPDREQEFLQTLSEKDQTISNLQSEIELLKVKAESMGVPGAAPASDSEANAKLQGFLRRAETASEVSDSVISDLAELISQVEASPLDVSAQIALTTLIKSMGRAMGRVSEAPGGLTKTEPKIELIGAVMIAHEIVDGIKKMTRGA